MGVSRSRGGLLAPMLKVESSHKGEATDMKDAQYGRGCRTVLCSLCFDAFNPEGVPSLRIILCWDLRAGASWQQVGPNLNRNSCNHLSEQCHLRYIVRVCSAPFTRSELLHYEQFLEHVTDNQVRTLTGVCRGMSSDCGKASDAWWDWQ